MTATALAGGFATPPHDAARAFRSLMQAMARPGTLHPLAGAKGPAPLSIAAAVTIATLCDPDTGLALMGGYNAPELRQWIGFNTGARIVAAEHADFVIGVWDDLLPLDVYKIGTAEYPDRSATLIVEMPDLAPSGATLRGPGIQDSAHLSLPDIAPFQANAARFPLGLDFIFTAGSQVAALPRTTEVC